MSDSRRRKSLTILRPPVTALTPIDEPSGSSPPSSLLKKRLPENFASSSPIAPSPTSSLNPPSTPVTPIEIRHKSSMERLVQKARPRSLQRSTRPSSFLGSFKGLSLQDEEENNLTRTSSHPSVSSQSEYLYGLSSSQVLLHGDVQTASGVFRKRSQYLVLTETHLVKFRSQNRASEIFPCIPSSIGRASGNRHSRLSSSGSLHDLHASNEGLQAVPLNQIVAIYRLDDGKPYFSVDISCLDEESMQASSMTLQLHDPRDHDLWLSSIRGAAMNARLKDPLPFSQHLIEYTAKILEQERDYDPHQLHMFRVVQRSGKSGVGISRSSSDDLPKLTSNVCILAIGVFKLHLVPLPKSSRTLSSTSLSDLNGLSYGLTSLTEFTVGENDDSFLLKFRTPLRKHIPIHLASSCVTDIALSTRRTADFLRPKWPEQPFTWNCPEIMDEEFLPIPPIDEENEALNRTLAAYCAAYGLDASSIIYTVNPACEDGPAFCLITRSNGQNYTVLELLAVMRALRYNESFGTLSFSKIDLNDLQRLRDSFGDEHVAWRTRSGEPLDKDEERKYTLLVQEIRALALNSTSLRRLDFSYCLNNRSRSLHDKAEDQGCGVCEGLFKMCVKQATNIDWVILNGIPLSEVDLDYLFSAAIDRSCHFRAIDVGYCSLGDRSIHTVVNALTHQNATLECLDLSGNTARLDPQDLFSEFMSFCFIRKMNLSHISRVSSGDALLPAELLLKWKLEELLLSRTALNEESVDAIGVYLQSPQSAALKLLDLEQCQLSGKDAATLFDSSSKQDFHVRDLRIILSGNRIENGHDAFVDVIRRGKCPAQVVLQMIDYQTERNFRRLLDAFADCTCLIYLDVAKVSLPCDADKATCESLRRLLTSNHSLRYLDISGEQTHLVACSLGSGLNSALIGLKANTTLEVLRVEHQNLGLQGASTLASVIEENCTLKEIHCEGNEINLQAFTVLVNSLERNETVQYLPDMTTDRAWAQKKVEREVNSLIESNNAGSATMSSTKATVKRTLGRTMTGQRSNHSRISSGSLSTSDMQAAVGSLSEQWDKEVARLQEYLARNYHLADGMAPGPPGYIDVYRPGTSSSLEAAMRDFSLERTPKAELDRQLSEIDNVEGPEVLGDGLGDEAEDVGSPLEMRKQ